MEPVACRHFENANEFAHRLGLWLKVSDLIIGDQRIACGHGGYYFPTNLTSTG
ncbi:hypothetical protein MPLSOD_260087 [Mesorhizobium sp. SOD10]|nr:hypothetical protein MPLSOD_260087 [Mesorhizobium sp. SOD10]